ncbi:BTB/POZ and MATH domain-containing protein 2 [Hordeum vulgare]|nr:BTB/POZ and MATH domain-containing protein 2 [Hordeum vulgare]
MAGSSEALGPGGRERQPGATALVGWARAVSRARGAVALAGGRDETQEAAVVSFNVNGEVFAAHKVILAMRSPVFKAEFYGPMSNEQSKQSVTIEDMQPAAFKAPLHFMYTDSLPPMDGLNDEEVRLRCKESRAMQMSARERFAMMILTPLVWHAITTLLAACNTITVGFVMAEASLSHESGASTRPRSMRLAEAAGGAGGGSGRRRRSLLSEDALHFPPPYASSVRICGVCGVWVSKVPTVAAVMGFQIHGGRILMIRDGRIPMIRDSHDLVIRDLSEAPVVAVESQHSDDPRRPRPADPRW